METLRWSWTPLLQWAVIVLEGAVHEKPSAESAAIDLVHGATLPDFRQQCAGR
jgi:hypothetical protein